MKNRSRWDIAAGACGAMLTAIAVVSCAPATAAKGEPLPRPAFSDEQAADTDATAIARMEGLTPAEAQAVIDRQAAIGEVIPELEDILGAANAGISVDVPETSTTLTVRAAGKLPKATTTQLATVRVSLRSHRVDLKLIEGMEHSLSELTAAAESLDVGGNPLGDVVGVGVDVVNNELFAEVTRLGTISEAAVSEMNAVAGASTSAPIRVSERLVESGSNER